MKEIKLTKGKFALVDDDMFATLNEFRWYAQECPNTTYAARKSQGRLIYMHRVVLGVDGKRSLVDHRDRNGLNNQIGNLRVATASQNNSNVLSRNNSTSKYLGVCWFKITKKWSAQIHHNGKKINLGYFHCEVEAAKAYDKKALEIKGEFANLNFTA